MLAVTSSSCGSVSRLTGRKLCWMWLASPATSIGHGSVLGWLGPEDQQARGRTGRSPVVSLAMQGRDDQFELLVAIDVRPLDSMQCRFGGNREHFPRRRRPGGILPDPLERAGVLPRPAGAKRDIEPAIAVDVVRGNRHVVGRRRAAPRITSSPSRAP